MKNIQISYIYLFINLKWIYPIDICKLTFLFHKKFLKKGHIIEGLRSIFLFMIFKVKICCYVSSILRN